MKNKDDIKLTKKISIVILDVFITFFLIFALVFMLFAVFSFKDENSAVGFFKYEFRTLSTDSMGESEQTDVTKFEIKSLPKNTLLVIEKTPEEVEGLDVWYGNLKPGDVLTFSYKYAKRVVITHRITSIKAKTSGGYIIELSGDNKSSTTVPLNQTIDTSKTDSNNFIIGKVVNSSRFWGRFMVSIKNPIILFICVTIPCFAIIVYQVVKVTKERAGNKLRKQEEEILYLKSKLANKK